jgi:hypothetical protein
MTRGPKLVLEICEFYIVVLAKVAHISWF